MTQRVALGRLSHRAAVRVLIEDTFAWDAADRIQERFPLDPTLGGRPREYPLVTALLWAGLVAIFGSSRQVETELGCPDSPWWTMIRDAAAEIRPDLRLPETPMRRHHYEWLRNQHLTHDGALFEICDEFRAHAARQAVIIGLCDSTGDGSLTHPSLERGVAGDGKVISSRYKTHPKDATTVNTKTGEIRTRRTDPDADNFTTGGGTPVFGTRFVLTSTRGVGRNRRIILDVTYAPTQGGEAKWALEALHQVLPHLPGAQTVLYDGAFRGKHIRELMKIDGVIPITRVSKGKDHYYGPADVRRADRSTGRVELHLVNGSPCLREIAVDGTPIITPLTRIKTRRNKNTEGWRWYNEYEIPNDHGGGTLRLRLDQTADDIAKGFNREENLRVIAPDDPDHHNLYGLRADTESGNRLLDDSMLRERAHTVGHHRQQLDVIMWATVRNAAAVHQHRRTGTVEPPDQLAA